MSLSFSAMQVKTLIRGQNIRNRLSSARQDKNAAAFFIKQNLKPKKRNKNTNVEKRIEKSYTI